MEVLTAESAEIALEILSTSRPDVIFMDHMMPGMDGFQALRAIKNNPATATIPIMMYTSQSGELYVGQARALGAVGVLPKQIKPVEVSQLLESLHLVPGLGEAGSDAAEVADEAEAMAAEASDIEGAMRPGDWDELHRWLEEMLRHHVDSLRGDIESSMRRLFDERFGGAANDAADDEAAATVADEPRRSALTTALVAGLALIAAVFLWLHLDTQRKWQEVSMQNAALLAAMDRQRLAEAEGAVGLRDYLDAERDNLSRRYRDYLEALEWSVNQTGEYGVGEMPLGDSRLEIISGLLERLRDSGFEGAIEVSVHAGDFCLQQDANGRWRAAEASLPVADCDRIGWPTAEGFAQSPRESVAFANFRTELASLDSAIDLRVEDVGNLMPMYAYPVNPQGATADDWNRVAARNNRVQVRLLPAEDPRELLSLELPSS
jgi:CheY-like chemotaxis protein